MTTTRQSIVTWIPWPENGVDGLPEDEHRIFIRTDEGVEWRVFELRGHVSRMLITGKIGITHYALASDLETVHEIDGDKCSILPRALIDRARADRPTVDDSAIVQTEDRVRWLVEQACILAASSRISEPHDAIERVLSFELDAIRQVKEERERKEGGHE